MPTHPAGLSDAARSRLAVALLAVVAYVPALLSSPGRMPADTKLALYFDPAGLTRLAASSWDPSQFGGWVPHQMTTYLWPSGPWFWLFESLGVPDWVAHRLWLGTLFLLAGWGVLRLARLLGLPLRGAIVAALAYELSTYVLPYVSRTSLMLLPWVALGWLTILTIHTVRRGGWRYPALFGLVIVSVAHVNPTAFLMVVPGPVLWVAIEWAARRVTARQVLVGSAKLAAIAAGVSVWWVTMLTIQDRFGADVLGYSETLEAVSFTSTGTEVVRGLGYWLFYIRDPYAPATASSIAYQTSPALIAVGFALTLVCLTGLAATTWTHRRFAIGLVVTGLVLSVGVHPTDDPSPLMHVVRDSRLALALRSSTRALPLMVLGLGLGAGALVAAVGRWRGHAATAGALLLVAVNVPSIWQAELVDAGLDRDQDPPAAWLDAAAALDAGDTGARVLQLPGAEFGAFRWGFTVDQPLPSLTRKPVLTRDLLPLGTPAVMDLLYALDNRVQAGALDIRAVAPVARLLGADTVWLANDEAFDRFRTPRPEPLADSLSVAVDGLGEPVAFGSPAVDVPDVPMLDEEALSDPRIGRPLAPVVLRAVDGAPRVVRVADEVVVLDGSGDGLVDAATAGVLAGDEAVFYAADLAGRSPEVPEGGTVRYVVTDSARDRDEQWRGSQDAVGMTESGGPGSDTRPVDDAQRRLPRRGEGDPATQTIAMLDGGLRATATSYGEPFAFLPEARAAMAVDGDPSTAWRVGVRGTPIGESITLSGAPDGRLRLVQAQGRSLLFMITRVAIDAGGERRELDLTEASLGPEGQVVDVRPGVPTTMTILASAPRPGAPATGEAWVGFAELGPVARELVRPPTGVLDGLAAGDDVAIVFNRERVTATNRWRSDPEPRLARTFELPIGRAGDLAVTLRLDRRAPDAVIDALTGIADGPAASDRLAGVPSARAIAAFDGDPSTAWASPFHTAVGSRIDVPLDPGVPVADVALTQPPGPGARITEVRLTIGDRSAVVAVEPDGTTAIDLAAASGDRATIEITATDGATTTDRRYGDPALLPVAIAEVTGLPVAIERRALQACRDDLLTIDGVPVPLAVDSAALAAGEAVDARPCDGAQIDLAAGRHVVIGSDGATTGVDVDLLSWRSPGAGAGRSVSTSQPVGVVAHTSTSWTLDVPACPAGCWLVFGQGYNDGWEATDGELGSLGSPTPVSGGANGWWLPPDIAARRVSVTFSPQGTLRAGIWLSAAAVLACLLAIVAPASARAARRRRRSSAADPPPEREATERAGAAHRTGPADPVVSAPELATLRGAPTDLSRRSAVVAAAVVTVTSAAFIAPLWALAGLAAGAALVVIRRTWLVAAAGIGGLALLAAVVVRRQLRYDYVPGGAWPNNFGDLHRFALFAMLLACVTWWASERGADGPPAGHDGTRDGDDDG